jgi:hypothetical protein
MNEFERYAFNQVRQALEGIEEHLLADIYALSFYVSDQDRYPLLQLGYNTRSRARECTPAPGQAPGWPIASDAHEATWNFAFWLQNELAFVPAPETQGERLLEEALKEQGLWSADEADGADAFFVTMCVRVAQALHAAGAIGDRFPQAVPIIIHGLDYYEAVALQTEAANPPGLAREFVDWVRGL